MCSSDLHTGTGTHTMQFAMYFLVDKQLIPGNLVQTFRDEGKKSDSYGRARVIALSYPAILQAIQKRRETVEQRLLAGIETLHDDLKKRIDVMAKIGSETNDPILIYGDPGTGKTRIARVVHDEWAKKEKTRRKIARGIHDGRENKSQKKKENTPFKAVNCAGLTPAMAQSILFGHIKGAFTGAHEKREGLLKEADGGTLFLDEIAELDLSTQAMMLKALEEQKFYRLGDSKQEIEVKFRLICATNKNLETQVAQGKFREDLLTRIRSWTFYMPNLKERSKDIEANMEYELKKWFQDKSSERREQIVFSKAAKKAYLSFAYSPEASWTGNFRDLGQSVRRMATLTSIQEAREIDETIVREETDRLQAMWQPHRQSNIPDDDTLAQHILSRFDDRGSLCLVDDLERFLQNYALQTCDHNKGKAAKVLYESSRCALSNPSSKFNQRVKRIGQEEKE